MDTDDETREELVGGVAEENVDDGVGSVVEGEIERVVEEEKKVIG